MSALTKDLFLQYKKHLGAFRYWVLIEAQKLVVPGSVKALMRFSDFSLITPAVPVYKLFRLMKLDGLLKNTLLPADYKNQINQLNVQV